MGEEEDGEEEDEKGEEDEKIEEEESRGSDLRCSNRNKTRCNRRQDTRYHEYSLYSVIFSGANQHPSETNMLESRSTPCPC
jgi:hypothetical protein